MEIDEHVKFYNEYGWVKIEGLLSEKELERAQQEITKFMSQAKHELQGRDINLVEGEINSIHKLEQNKWVDQMRHSKKISDIIAKFIGEKPQARKSELFVKPAEVGLEVPVHQDNYYWGIKDSKGLTVWIALDYCDEENGCIWYLSKSHLVGLLKHQKSFAPGSSQTIRAEDLPEHCEKATHKLKPGDALLHHCLTVHGSDPNRSERSRRGWTMQFKAESSVYDPNITSRYEMELKEQLVARGQESL
jgi:phytanoyl-CoA hydroxylase